MRPVLQSGHGVASARQGIGRATRIGPSDGSQVVAGWKKARSEFLILAIPRFCSPTSKVTDDHMFICQNSLFQHGVVGAFAWGFGVLTSDFGVGKSQELGC